MHQVLAHTSSRSRMTLIDAPPILPVTDAAILSTMADGVILVVDPSHTKRRDLRRARESIEGVGGKIIGVVINKVSPKGAGYHYYYHQYGYKYTYGYGPENDGRGGKGKAAVTAGDPKVLSRKG
jgi:Mrp family chromosome partitioning ATPase